MISSQQANIFVSTLYILEWIITENFPQNFTFTFSFLLLYYSSIVLNLIILLAFQFFSQFQCSEEIQIYLWKEFPLAVWCHALQKTCQLFWIFTVSWFFRNNHAQVFCKKLLLKVSQNSQENIGLKLCYIRTPWQMFLLWICEIFEINFSSKKSAEGCFSFLTL